MILRIIERAIALFTNLTMPATPPHGPLSLAPPPLAEGDGRRFGWQRTRTAARRPAMPVIIYDIRVGGMKEYVGDFHLMKPHEYGDDLETLAERYPCPPIEQD